MGCCDCFCKCIWDVIRSIPIMCIIACTAYAAGGVYVMMWDAKLFAGVASIGGEHLSEIDAEGFLTLALAANGAINMFIGVLALFTTGWVLEKCCQKSADEGCCTKCFKCCFGQIMHSLFFLLALAALVLMIAVLAFIAWLTAIALLESSACDSDALVALNSGNAPPYNRDTGPPIAADQAAAGYFLMSVLQVAGQSVPIVSARQRAVGSCCGNNKYGVNKEGLPPMGTVIDHTCSTMGECMGIVENDDAVCRDIIPMYLADKSIEELQTPFHEVCLANPVCAIKAAPAESFVEAVKGVFIGVIICVLAQILVVLHIQKKVLEFAYESNIEEKGDSESGHPMMGHHPHLRPAAQVVSYTPNMGGPYMGY